MASSAACGGLEGLHPAQPCPPDLLSIAAGFSPEKPKREGRFITRTWDGRFERSITIVRHALGGYVVVPDAPAADARPLKEIGTGELLWLEVR